MYYYTLELYPPLLAPIIPKTAKIAKLTLLSEPFDTDIQAQFDLQHAITELVPEADQPEVINEYNPMFFPNQEDDELTESAEELMEASDFMEFNPFEMNLTDTEAAQIFEQDVMQSAHYLINQEFEQILLYGRCYISAEAASRLNFETITTVH